ncbi:hypothetical protein GCM10010330_74680 [Streptomyces tendae]|nr:hypothetical protein GCM10010330_74680 [Streptomyces tendae]
MGHHEVERQIAHGGFLIRKPGERRPEQTEQGLHAETVEIYPDVAGLERLRDRLSQFFQIAEYVDTRRFFRARLADRVEKDEGHECGEGTADEVLRLEEVSQRVEDLGGHSEGNDEGERPFDDAGFPVTQ